MEQLCLADQRFDTRDNTLVVPWKITRSLPGRKLSKGWVKVTTHRTGERNPDPEKWAELTYSESTD